jgi:hypothetical protein
MEFKFVISKPALFVTALIKGAKIDNWVDLQNELWDKYKQGYQLLQGNAVSIFATEASEEVLEKATVEVKLLMREGLESAKFQILLQNAEEYKVWLEEEWLKNKEKVEKELKDILRVKLPEDTFTVYVMGDLLSIGRHLGKQKFAWGHKEDWPNYSLVYLAHEYLHSVFSSSNIEHAVIELITDNELRIRLSNGGEYFVCNGESVGHDYLRDIEENLLPKWKEYLLDKDRDIYSFIDSNSK